MASNTGTVGTTGHMREGGAGPTTSDSRPGHLHEGGAQPGVHHSEGGVAPTTTHHTKGAVVAPTTHHESEDVRLEIFLLSESFLVRKIPLWYKLKCFTRSSQPPAPGA